MAAITLNWVGGEHEFRLTIGQLRKLQETCGAGPLAIMYRIREGTWLVDDLMETLRLGLIGGGMDRAEAGAMVSRLFDQYPLVQFALPAQAVLISALITEEKAEDDPGPADEAPPEKP